MGLEEPKFENQVFVEELKSEVICSLHRFKSSGVNNSAMWDMGLGILSAYSGHVVGPCVTFDLHSQFSPMGPNLG